MLTISTTHGICGFRSQTCLEVDKLYTKLLAIYITTYKVSGGYTGISDPNFGMFLLLNGHLERMQTKHVIMHVCIYKYYVSIQYICYNVFCMFLLTFQSCHDLFRHRPVSSSTVRFSIRHRLGFSKKHIGRQHPSDTLVFPSQASRHCWPHKSRQQILKRSQNRKEWWISYYP